jgi:mRNA interferase MazF
MERFVKGDVVVVPFPFSYLSSSKKRPALVLSSMQTEDILLCQITSQEIKDSYSVSLESSDFLTGHLPKLSNIRPNRIFTVSKSLILYKVGSVNSKKTV